MPAAARIRAKKCAACHTFGKGEPNRVGPNLWGVVGRPKASEAGFNYSAAMKAQKGNWTPEDLDIYLTNPRAMVPGTNMTFAGIPRGKERADVITYLNTKSDKPVELPKQAAARRRREAAPAGRAPKPQRLGSAQAALRRAVRRPPRAAAWAVVTPARIDAGCGRCAGGDPSKNRHNRLSIVA